MFLAPTRVLIIAPTTCTKLLIKRHISLGAILKPTTLVRTTCSNFGLLESVLWYSSCTKYLQVRHLLAPTGFTSTFSLFSSGGSGGAGAFFAGAFLFLGVAAASSGSKASTLLFVFLAAAFLGIFF